MPTRPLLSKSEAQSLVDDAKAVIGTHRNKKGDLCFPAKSLVEFLVTSSRAEDVDLAVRQGRMAELYGYIREAEGCNQFDNTDDLFCFVEPGSKIKKYGKKVSLSKKKLRVISPYTIGRICETEAVQQLVASNNLLTELPGALFAYNGMGTRLTRIDFSNNQIEEIPPQVSHLRVCVEFNISSNRIKELPEQMSSMTSLEVLNLNNNSLTELPKFIAEFRNLKKLTVTNNQLESVPYCLGKLSPDTLKTLALYDNPLGDPPSLVLMGGSSAILPYLKKKYNEQRAKSRAHARSVQSQPALESYKSDLVGKSCSTDELPAMRRKTDAQILSRILKDSKGRESFKSFLMAEHSEENFLFWEDVERFRNIETDDAKVIEKEASRIFQKYFSSDAELEINVPAKLRKKVQSTFATFYQASIYQPIEQDIFDEVQAKVLKVLEEDSLKRYLQSDAYKTYKTIAYLKS